MTNKLIDIQSYLDELLPQARCELFYTQDYELVLAVMLSAQTTDKSVNNITRVLFKEHPTLESLSLLSIEEIEEYLKPLGLYKNKALYFKEIVDKLIKEFNGIVPSNKELLMTLPGVGNKTAGVIRAEVFKIPDFPVDTHIKRISLRLGLSKHSDPYQIEQDLKKKFEEKNWIKLHHQFIHFGRCYCQARSPRCEECKIRKYCKN